MRLTKIQHQLRELMSDTSELHYSAGWMEHTEYRLWQFAVDGTDDGEWGFYTLAPALRGRLLELARTAGGWIAFPEDRRVPHDRQGNSFVPMSDWLVMFEVWKSRPQA